MKDNYNMCPLNTMLDFPITYQHASVLCQSLCACLHQKVKKASFLFINIKYLPKRESTHANVQSLSLKRKEGIQSRSVLTCMHNCLKV